MWRETTLKTHELFPVDVSFVKPSKTSVEFEDLLEQNPSLANSFQDQFIPGLNYSFTLNTQLREDIAHKYEPKSRRRSDFYLNTTVGLAGNLLKLVQSMSSDREVDEFFGLPYSQYIRAEIDFRYYLQLDRHQKLATRLSIGTGYAYGNSTYMPYIKQFAVGGSNSLRAFPARSVGPGTYNVRTDSLYTSSTYFIDQRGDVKIEGSVEYRFDIIKALKGAVFVDGGNIWLLKEDVNRPGGKFNKDIFLGELAVGTGVGLRYDFGFFVLRLDVATPLRKPYLEKGDRWVVDEIDLGSREWRRENLILNIAIGYPF
jgi:hypothetical protein